MVHTGHPFEITKRSEIVKLGFQSQVEPDREKKVSVKIHCNFSVNIKQTGTSLTISINLLPHQPNVIIIKMSVHSH